MIVKVQVARSSNNQVRALVYNKDRSFRKEFLANKDIQEVVGIGNKMYFEAVIEGGELVLNTPVDEQPW